MGISSSFVDATDLAAIEAAITPETRGIYLETPSNPLLKVTDLRGAVAIARRHGLITLVDNTFMTPYLQRPLELGCDIVLHSGTKFLNGHSDVICGFAVVKDAELGQRIRYIQNAFGTGLGPQDSFLTLRGIRTLKVRMDQSQLSTIRIAAWLKAHQRVTAVHYPGMPSTPARPMVRGRSSPSSWTRSKPPSACWKGQNWQPSPSVWGGWKASSPTRPACRTPRFRRRSGCAKGSPIPSYASRLDWKTRTT